MMAAGGAWAMAGVDLPLVEIGIGFSVVTLGAMVRCSRDFHSLPRPSWPVCLRCFMDTRMELKRRYPCPGFDTVQVLSLRPPCCIAPALAQGSLWACSVTVIALG